MAEQIFQVLLLTFTGVFTIVSILIGFTVRSFLVRYKEDKDMTEKRLNAHSDKIDNLRQGLVRTQSDLKSNERQDEARMELVKSNYYNIQNILREIQSHQVEQQKELKHIDRRLTDYIIGEKSKVA